LLAESRVENEHYAEEKTPKAKADFVVAPSTAET